jgi:DNA-binding MarR family transcriptional regulator
MVNVHTFAMSPEKSTLQQEIKQRRPFRSPAAEAIVALLRSSDIVRSRLAALGESHGVTLQQYNVLRILRGAHPDPLPTLEIGERMIERQPGITRLLDRLEAKELVRRDRCTTDRRVVHAWITAEGLELLASLDEPVETLDREMLALLSSEETRTLIRLLAKVRAGAQ